MACSLEVDDVVVKSTPGPDAVGETPPSPGLNDEEFQQLKDRILIVVGSGIAVEKLAQRRLGSRGRLCIVETEDASRVVTESAPPAAKAPPDLWSPPRYEAGTVKSALAARFKAGPPSQFVKKGPDVVKLQLDETLQVISFAGKLVGVRAVGDGGETRWEMSGAVILNPSSADAQSIDVEVQDPEAETMAYLDIKYVILSMVINFVVFTISISVSSVGEEAATQGQVPWWRMTFFTLFTLTSGPLCVKGFCLMNSGVEPPMGIYVGVALAGAWVVSCVATLNGLSDFLASVLWCLPQLVGAQVMVFATRKRLPKRTLFDQGNLGNTFTNLSLGVYILFYCLALAYLAILASGRVLLASLFLPI